MHIVIEGPDLKEVNFNQVQRSEPLHSIIIIYNSDNFWGGGNSSWGGEIPGRPYPCMKPWMGQERGGEGGEERGRRGGRHLRAYGEEVQIQQTSVQPTLRKREENQRQIQSVANATHSLKYGFAMSL